MTEALILDLSAYGLLNPDHPDFEEVGSSAMNGGCPVCSWDGEIAYTNNYKYQMYTHVVVRNGHLHRGKTCRVRKREPSFLTRLLQRFK